MQWCPSLSNTPSVYWYCGLSVASTLPLPELSAVPEQATLPDLSVCTSDARVIPTDAAPDWRHDWLEADDKAPAEGEISLSGLRIGARYGLVFPEVGEAWFGTGGDIALWREPQASVESLRHVLLDQILPRLLAQRGHLVLHGSLASTTDGHHVVAIGDSGMGKSTLASAFALAGGAVLTDDCLSIAFEGDRPCATPSYPGLRLWPDSLTALFPEREAEGTPMTHYSDKQRLAPASVIAPRSAPPIDAILVLQHSDSSDAVELSPLSPQQACMALIGNAFQLDMGDLRHTHRLLGLAAELARCVPVLALRHPRDYNELPRVIEHIRAHLSEPAFPPKP